jgi:hypothetical protein
VPVKVSAKGNSGVSSSRSHEARVARLIMARKKNKPVLFKKMDFMMFYVYGL